MENNKIKYELPSQSRERMKQKKLGSLNPNYGRPRSEETKAKIAQSQRKRWAKYKTTGKNSDDYFSTGSFQFESKEEALIFFNELSENKGRIIILSESGFLKFLKYLHKNEPIME